MHHFYAPFLATRRTLKFIFVAEVVAMIIVDNGTRLPSLKWRIKWRIKWVPWKCTRLFPFFLAISTDIRFAKKGLNRLEQVSNPSLGLALALASILAPNN